LYIDVSFKLSNPVPMNGKIVVDFEGIDVFNSYYKLDNDGGSATGTKDYCFVEWINRDISCDTLNT